jgi:hypothetical protein
MDNFTHLADQALIEKTISSLEANGFKAVVVNSSAEAKAKALELIPAGAEVMTMTSVTVDSIGLSEELNKSGKYNSIRAKFAQMDSKTQGLEMRKLGAGPEYTVGSVHAITSDGKVLIASATGSQLPAYAYGAMHVIWIASTKKIVADETSALKRIYEHVLPLESVRANQAYNITSGSSVNKILTMNKEVPDRITLILVKEDLGF